jgi:hypothetical protein
MLEAVVSLQVRKAQLKFVPVQSVESGEPTELGCRCSVLVVGSSLVSDADGSR